MAFTRFSSTDPADLAALLNRLGDELEAQGTSWGEVTGKPTSYPPASHTHAWPTITGKPTTYPPAAHSHAVADVTGLASRLTALEYASGWRNITALMAVQPESGNLYARREGRRVWMQSASLRFAASASFVTLSNLLPSGWRPTRVTDLAIGRRATADPGGAFRANSDGTCYFYQVLAGASIEFAGDFLTDNPINPVEPGSPA